MGFKSAATVIEELGITEPGEIKIEAIAQYCGATIIYEPLDGCDARILGHGDRAIITVDSRAPRGGQRFSAGHELGHWMRDRGKVAFSCEANKFIEAWDADGPEQRANRYAADLLLPKSIFTAQARGQSPTFSSAKALAKQFETSLTASAIRLVELGSYLSMLVCSTLDRRKWFFRSPDVPTSLWPTLKPGPGSQASKLLRGASATAEPTQVDADDWIDHPEARRYWLLEDTLLIGESMALTLLWWKDESQLLDLDEDPEGSQEP